MYQFTETPTHKEINKRDTLLLNGNHCGRKESNLLNDPLISQKQQNYIKLNQKNNINSTFSLPVSPFRKEKEIIEYQLHKQVKQQYFKKIQLDRNRQATILKGLLSGQQDDCDQISEQKLSKTQLQNQRWTSILLVQDFLRTQDKQQLKFKLPMPLIEQIQDLDLQEKTNEKIYLLQKSAQFKHLKELDKLNKKIKQLKEDGSSNNSNNSNNNFEQKIINLLNIDDKNRSIKSSNRQNEQQLTSTNLIPSSKQSIQITTNRTSNSKNSNFTNIMNQQSTLLDSQRDEQSNKSHSQTPGNSTCSSSSSFYIKVPNKRKRNTSFASQFQSYLSKDELNLLTKKNMVKECENEETEGNDQAQNELATLQFERRRMNKQFYSLHIPPNAKQISSGSNDQINEFAKQYSFRQLSQGKKSSYYSNYSNRSLNEQQQQQLSQYSQAGESSNKQILNIKSSSANSCNSSFVQNNNQYKSISQKQEILNQILLQSSSTSISSQISKLEKNKSMRVPALHKMSQQFQQLKSSNKSTISCKQLSSSFYSSRQSKPQILQDVNSQQNQKQQNQASKRYSSSGFCFTPESSQLNLLPKQEEFLNRSQLSEAHHFIQQQNRSPKSSPNNLKQQFNSRNRIKMQNNASLSPSNLSKDDQYFSKKGKITTANPNSSTNDQNSKEKRIDQVFQSKDNLSLKSQQSIKPQLSLIKAIEKICKGIEVQMEFDQSIQKEMIVKTLGCKPFTFLITRTLQQIAEEKENQIHALEKKEILMKLSHDLYQSINNLIVKIANDLGFNESTILEISHLLEANKRSLLTTNLLEELGGRNTLIRLIEKIAFDFNKQELQQNEVQTSTQQQQQLEKSQFFNIVNQQEQYEQQEQQQNISATEMSESFKSIIKIANDILSKLFHGGEEQTVIRMCQRLLEDQIISITAIEFFLLKNSTFQLLLQEFDKDISLRVLEKIESTRRVLLRFDDDNGNIQVQPRVQQLLFDLAQLSGTIQSFLLNKYQSVELFHHLLQYLVLQIDLPFIAQYIKLVLKNGSDIKKIIEIFIEILRNKQTSIIFTESQLMNVEVRGLKVAILMGEEQDYLGLFKNINDLQQQLREQVDLSFQQACQSSLKAHDFAKTLDIGFLCFIIELIFNQYNAFHADDIFIAKKFYSLSEEVISLQIASLDSILMLFVPHKASKIVEFSSFLHKVLQTVDQKSIESQ